MDSCEAGAMTAGEYMEMLQNRRRYHLRRLVAGAESQGDLAKRAGMHQEQVSKILAGRMPFTEFRARKVEQFLGLAFGLLDKEVS